MKKYLKATQQDALIEIFPEVFLLRGSIRIGPCLQMNRNMVVIRQGESLILINAVRLNEENLEYLNQLGQIKHLIRLGDFHGLDDQFYRDNYNATFWSQLKHQNYAELIPDVQIDESTESPIENSQFFIFNAAKFPESILFLRNHKLLISTDSIQYWDDWRYVSCLSQLILKVMGFRLGLFIGGPWLKRVSKNQNSLKSDFEHLMSLDFDSVIGAHGNILRNSAKFELKKVLEQTFND